uniref:Si:dkey-202e22.2 n=1 Tax=Oreochromis niloticus TaxID=8128 RepID=I3KWX2_ORENI
MSNMLGTPRHLMLVALVSSCLDRACSPPIGNLASGRTLFTLSNCCGNGTSQHPLCPQPSVSPQACSQDPHPVLHMTDDPFLHPDTWWASGGGRTMQEQQDEIRLDLETKFYLTHLVLVFKSPRPAAMAIERSVDFGKTWEAVKVFAYNCSVEFGLPDDFDQPGSPCTSRYTDAAPCTGGEVILRTLNPSSAMTLDPYSPEALSRLTITNLRVRLLKSQTFRTPPSSSENSASAPYAIYTLLARGTCLCHGHAEYCVPHNNGNKEIEDSNMVFGRCLCTHHTAGDHCDKCAPLYNDRPWRPANGSSGEANPCQKCECHGHAATCHFSQRAWLSSGRLSGGVCEDCQHNTAGRRCHRCRYGYHRRPSLPLSSPHTCTRKSHKGPWCHPRSGQCHCKSGVGGTSCSHCLPGYWGFGGEGCKPCTCPHQCDPFTGQCLHSITLFLYTGKCSCKEKKLRSVSELCKTKPDYVIKANVLSAHDKGSHAEVHVKVRKVLRSGQVALRLGTANIYPLSWTSRGCTCPILNPGMEYLLAGKEEPGTGRLLVTMQSIVVPWTPRVGLIISNSLRNGCR